MEHDIADLGLVRIDDRLIHGQVVANWVKVLRSRRIVIVDDDVAADSFMQNVMRLAAPPGVTVEVYSLQEGINVLKGKPLQADKILVLLKSPQVAEQLYRNGVHFKVLNVGGLGAAPGRRPVFKSISLSDEELAILQRLVDRGVEVTLQTVPGEKKVSLASLLSRL
ncbi:MAG: PTS sugar transporter subunit IIB [Anaerolineae bacterium]|nr:PTS sugar transporter subunit IIB [Anaerolineae bacterium]